MPTAVEGYCPKCKKPRKVVRKVAHREMFMFTGRFRCVHCGSFATAKDPHPNTGPIDQAAWLNAVELQAAVSVWYQELRSIPEDLQSELTFDPGCSGETWSSRINLPKAPPVESRRKPDELDLLIRRHSRFHRTKRLVRTLLWTVGLVVVLFVAILVLAIVLS